MPGRSRLEKTSGVRLDQFHFTEVHHLKGQRQEASTPTIYWKETEWVLLWTQQQITQRGREKEIKPFRRHFTKNSSTFIFVSIDARILYCHANTAVAVWPYPGLQAIPTNTAN